MFKRTIRLLIENQKGIQGEKHKKLLDLYTPNDAVVDKINIPYEIRGEYLPRKKINPFKKNPLQVVYDRNDFQSFVLPSKRSEVYGLWGTEELFGVKRWRNDSPFIKEYVRVDNQIFAILLLILVLFWPLYMYRQKEVIKGYDTFLTHSLGKFTADDLL
jgi:hypothetical protein